METEKKNILTYESLKKYEEELHDLKVVRRREVAQKIKEAREQGDLSENAEYDAAMDEQRDIEARIEKLEKRCAEMNTTLQGLQTLVNKLQENDYVTRVETIYDGNTIIGYTLCFTHSDPITLYNGTDAGTPELGLGLGEDGIYYWTVKYPGDEQATFITDNFGVRLPASAHSPQLKIENGYWMVTYDGGEIWYNLGKATGEDGKSFFDSISQSGDYIQFSLLNGTEISIPTWDSFDKLQQAYTQTYRNLVSFVALSNHFLDKVSVSNVLPIVRGEETIGYQLVLTDGSTYDFYNGTNTNIPTILAQEKDGKPYLLQHFRFRQ